MAMVDFGSRATITHDVHREFRVELNEIRLKMKTDRVQRLNLI